VQLCNVFWIRSMYLWSICFVPWWWKILNAYTQRWKNTRTQQCYSRLIHNCKDLLQFSSGITKQLMPHFSQSEWLPLRPSGYLQCISEHHIPQIGSTNRRKPTQDRQSSPMWHGMYSLSSLLVTEWWPIKPLGKTWFAAGSHYPQAKPFSTRSSLTSVL